MSDSFYRDFEDRYRGSRELILWRLRVYAPLLRAVKALNASASAIDLGCGRGEWLQLLAESGITAQGVDLDPTMLAGCRERGLTVRATDALSALRELPAESQALVSAFHLVEHLPFETVRSLISEALRVLQPGGLLILETPNPENLVVGASSFYLDPSHLRPLPPQLLSFAVEHAGFARQNLLRLNEARPLVPEAAMGLMAVLDGVSPDYSVVAQKAHSAALPSAFDQIFQLELGLQLGTLAGRYDSQAQTPITELQTQLNHLGSQLDQVTQSYVWRALGPVDRRLQSIVRAAKQGRLLQAIGQKMLRLGVLARPVAIVLLNRTPRLKNWLRAKLHPEAAVAVSSALVPAPLSSRGAQIHQQLTQALDARKKP